MEKTKMYQESKHISAYLCLVCLLVLVFPIVSADLYITQVLYNPLITSTGGESVEIFNSGTKPINLSGYTLMTTTRDIDLTFPSDAIIPANSYYLVADTGWSEKKDCALYPLADYEQAITLRMTDGGVAIINPEGNPVDAVGWGNPNNIGNPLYMGTPANYTIKGEALKRISFTNNNQVDFICSIPEFTNSKNQTQDIRNNAIHLILDIPDISDYIKNVTIPFDYDDVILLNPGDEKILDVSFLLKDILEEADVSIILSSSYNNDEPIYYKSDSSDYNIGYDDKINGYINYNFPISLPHYLKPEDYVISIVVNDSSSLSNVYVKNISFKIIPILSFKINLNMINCSLAINNFCNITTQSSLPDIENPFISNLGNIPLDFKIYASDLVSEDNHINISSVELSLGNISSSKLTNEPLLYNTNLQPGPQSIIPFSLFIQPPPNLPGGLYSTKIIFMGVTNGDYKN
jgi:hypothetical protein